jgi:hypothetical protein
MSKITIELPDSDWVYLLKVLDRLYDEAKEQNNDYGVEILQRISQQLINELI